MNGTLVILRYKNRKESPDELFVVPGVKSAKEAVKRTIAARFEEFSKKRIARIGIAAVHRT